MVYFEDAASNFWSNGISGGGQKFGICRVKIRPLDGNKCVVSVCARALIKFRGKGMFDYFRPRASEGLRNETFRSVALSLAVRCLEKEILNKAVFLSHSICKLP